MATSKTTAKDDTDELFDKIGTGGVTAAADDDFDDLLDDVEEDDSEGWVPSEVGEGISGLEVKDGAKYRVIGYGAVLKRELQDADPQVGDRLAVKYFGEKPIKKGRFAGKPYKHFGLAIRRAGK